MSYIGSVSTPYESLTFGNSLSLKVEGGFNAVSINPSGRDVVLAGRQGLYIIDLDDPFRPPRWLHHKMPWQVADVQWSPHPAKPHWIVSTSNQKAIIWNLNKPSSNAIEYALHGHSRAITDINFNSQHPDILATCSIDTYVHAWDMRSPHRPFYTTSSWRSSASQVKWNFKDSNILASSHGNDVFIWDLRHGSTPLHKLTGHNSGVNSIDFSRFEENKIMSSSNDGTVKFWDLSKEEKCQQAITTEFPIWRGRYLPFGHGYCVMPMIGGNNSVYLMDLDVYDEEKELENPESRIEKLKPVQTFKGHSDRVIDFLWRSRHSYDSNIDDREFQLITWSLDSDLRLWPVTEDVYAKVNFERNKRLEEKLPSYEYMTYNREVGTETSSENRDTGYKRLKEKFVTNSGLQKGTNVSHIDWLSGVKMNRRDSTDDLFEDSKLQNLGEEVSALGRKFPKVVFEKISVSTGELTLTLNGPWVEDNPDEYIFLRIAVKFPQTYPAKGTAPRFMIEENDKLKRTKEQEILAMLKEIGTKYTDQNQYCLEPCLRFLLGEAVNLDDIGTIDDQPLLNFDIADHIGFEEFSSVSDEENDSHIIESSSSDSGSDLAKDPFGEQSELKDSFGRNTAFDSTPIPNQCGAFWTPTGQLLCFFPAESKLDKITHKNLKLTQKALNHRHRNRKQEPHEIFAESNITETDEKPKRYVDTLSANGTSNADGSDSSEEEVSSSDSFDSFANDWNDIIGNDIVVRTKLPMLYNSVTKKLGSLPAESVAGESTKKVKNIIIQKDFHELIPDDKSLALEYEVMGELPEDMARHNALVAERHGYLEISHCWQILSDLLLGERNNDPYTLIWDNHPMCIQWFVKETLKYFELENNLQMLATLCCVLASPRKTDRKSYDDLEDIPKVVENIITFQDSESPPDSRNIDTVSLFSNSNTIGQGSHEQYRLPKFSKSTEAISIRSGERHSSLHPITSNGRISSSKLTQRNKRLSNNSSQQQQQQYLQRSTSQSRMPSIKIELIGDEILEVAKNPNREILDPSEVGRFKKYVYQYAKLLFQWGLPIERAQILKVSLEALSTDHTSKKFNTSGSGTTERNELNSVAVCWLGNTSGTLIFRSCSYCNLRVKGDAFICGNCQHVLHAKCARQWWTVGDECPSGCGCSCPNLFDVR
ncbi:Mtc5p KNAG_0I01050 [Huiozyma naganishii CBS 8797]|uniref:RWD domain-containing protein n=1 Tax=Huiozyma naganishii (strain ATCC MYA-139 / BCRC 22969 / CBS 8797 / KCTC 17520 / NBRC 10181 / NCYC 3082 / Yp74L-3) TaxID=1071383 RepID=J7SA43_HUIN7|nr:hypothetical protein KNAG_0I01050 [Kazachstania naganishii CBS 8797]CCK71896.1 hypothetical protein KNAG_0I01050 [Kazachstania naganishii CBS 8797]